ncbi:SDR family oxidoreductase [Saccharopolyspora mangrovi]|uniref:NAD(P)H-binding protein n=1 Tax=Saccharopolyspora mangrovi TaxID=3082379 RepID=A0ABU6A3Y7_9PSEU|nr:NAD(P)H-binding protein [Saccharopolyspora sp. S2-29]MEB3366196.1 NAD(P)H-binding protein [Saccharopolyspora sp. S2-29]
MILLTAMAASRKPGAVPTAPSVRSLVGHLRRRGEDVRVLVPESEAHGWPDDVPVHLGPVTDPAAFAAAASGADRVFLAGLVGESLSSLRMLTDALVTGGIRRVVVLGSHGSDFEDEISEETWQWSAFERCLEVRGIGWVRLRPTAVMANASVGGYPIPGSAAVEAVRLRGEVHEHFPDSPYAFIHEDDLAEIAATLLLDDVHRGTVDVSGTAVTARERLAALNSALGTDARIVELSAEQAADRWRHEGGPRTRSR